MKPIIALGLAAALLGGCASLQAQVNAPLKSFDESTGYRLTTLSSERSSDEYLIVVSFSGGGKRSAAFAYGALEAMRDMGFTSNGRTSSLLHEVDLLTGVSGGSFPAAYYALYRDKMFETFRRDFLNEDLNDEIAGIYLLPWRWDWMVNPEWGTNDEMARVYDDLMFHGATFGDLEKLGPPFAIVQATDLASGTSFPFIQSQFDLICSDLSNYPIARAVAASNGFPILFTPITLRNYSAYCATEPAWIKPALADPDPLSRQRQQALLARRYTQADRDDYVHLIDGGVGDNLAMRGVLNYIARYDTPAMAPDPSGRLSRLRRVIFISIDGQSAADREINRTPVVGDILRIVDAVTSNTIDQYNFETLRLARSSAKAVADNLTAIRCAGHSGESLAASSALVHIALSEQPDAAALKEIPTGLTIAADQVIQLVAAGRQAVLTDATLRAVITGIDTPVPCPASVAQK